MNRNVSRNIDAMLADLNMNAARRGTTLRLKRKHEGRLHAVVLVNPETKLQTAILVESSILELDASLRQYYKENI